MSRYFSWGRAAQTDRNIETPSQPSTVLFRTTTWCYRKLHLIKIYLTTNLWKNGMKTYSTVLYSFLLWNSVQNDLPKSGLATPPPPSPQTTIIKTFCIYSSLYMYIVDFYLTNWWGPWMQRLSRDSMILTQEIWGCLGSMFGRLWRCRYHQGRKFVCLGLFAEDGSRAFELKMWLQGNLLERSLLCKV